MELKFDSGKNVFFTSDTHFFHKNILKYCKRPFESIEEMNEKLIENWNKTVSPDAYIFHLGDVCFGNEGNFQPILDRLNGHKILIKGNHDGKLLKYGADKWFEEVHSQLTIYVEDQEIIMNHYPLLTYAGAYGKPDGTYRTWNLFGHVHSGPTNETGLDNNRIAMCFPTQYDVGVDNNNYTPVSFSEVKEIITEQLMSLNMYRK